MCFDLLQLGGLGIEFQWGEFSAPTQHPIQWVLGYSWGLSGWGMALATHPI